MIIYEPLHEECEDCTHEIAVEIREGPETYEKYRHGQVIAELFAPTIEQMLKPSYLTEFLQSEIERAKFPDESI